MKEEPVVAQKGPYKVELLEGYRYAWCSCGLSKQQPFCDGLDPAKRPDRDVVWLQGQRQSSFLRRQPQQPLNRCWPWQAAGAAFHLEI